MESLLTVERLMTHLNLKRSQIDYLVLAAVRTGPNMAVVVP